MYPRVRYIWMVYLRQMTNLLTGLLAGLSCFYCFSAFANNYHYGLKATEVASGCYVVIGTEEYFTKHNGANVANAGFIVTSAGVLVIDTGPSRRYGEQLRALIGRVSNSQPVERVVITHAHPDHYLGNQAFSDVPIGGGQGTIDLIRQSGEDFTVNLYRLSGDWMRGTESIPPRQVLAPGVIQMGGHLIELIALAGHTPEDYAVLDHTCGVMYAGDLVFNRRTLSTPHADLDLWVEKLEQLKTYSFRYLVPGHGEVSEGFHAIDQTINYLKWLHQRLYRSFQSGLDITEVMELPVPQRFVDFSLSRDEYQRSVHNLYPSIEASGLPRID